LAEPVEPFLIQQVLEPGMTPIAAVAVIALHFDHGLRYPDHLLRRSKAQHVGEPWISVFLAVRLPHPATHEDVVAKELTAFLDYEEAEVVRVDVAAIDVGKRECDLEFAEQVAGPLDRLRLEG